jgi:hypothetical protein
MGSAGAGPQPAARLLGAEITPGLVLPMFAPDIFPGVITA